MSDQQVDRRDTAYALYRKGRPCQALELYVALLDEAGSSASKDVRLMMDAAVCARHSGRLYMALALNSRAIENGEGNFRDTLQNNLAIVYLDLADFWQADREFYALRARGPVASADYLCNHATAWQERGLYPLVCRVLKLILDPTRNLSTDATNAMLRLSLSVASMGLHDLALALVEQGLKERALQFPETHFRWHLGQLFAAQTRLRCGLRDEAAGDLQDVLVSLEGSCGAESLWAVRCRLVLAEAFAARDASGRPTQLLEEVHAGIEALNRRGIEKLTALRVEASIETDLQRARSLVDEAHSLADGQELGPLHWERIELLRIESQICTISGQPRKAAMKWINYARRLRALQGNNMPAEVLRRASELLANVGHERLVKAAVIRAQQAGQVSWADSCLRLLVISEDPADSQRLLEAMSTEGCEKLVGQPVGCEPEASAVRSTLDSLDDVSSLAVVVRLNRLTTPPISAPPYLRDFHQMRRWMEIDPRELAARPAIVRARWAWVVGRFEALPDASVHKLLDPGQDHRLLRRIPTGPGWASTIAEQLAGELLQEENEI